MSLDALRVKIREDAVVRNKAIYLALGGCPTARGENDILIAVTDDLKGMPEALATVFPSTTLQTCIVPPIARKRLHVAPAA